MPSVTKHRALADRWAVAKPAERANAQSYIIELCDALAVEPPRPAGSGYEFEFAIKLTTRDGTEAQGFVDCYKEGHFVLEAKDYEEGRSNDVLLRKAYGQARTYAAHDPSGVAPPYLMVLDVGKTLLVWDRWAGTFGGFAAARRIDLTRLHERAEDAALLADIWTNPSLRDPRTMSQAVTKDIARHLAELAASLEDREFDQERVARFLMRAVFTMFAEDVGLLPDEPFRRLLHDVAIPAPDEFPGAAEELWRAMDEGRRFGFRKLLRFNGHFFKDAEALPLSREDLAILLEASKADWSKVEPTIFGTLLTRALDPVERHRLGAEYTPPEFIERLVRPTIEEPVRERWTAVQAEVLQLRESKKAKDREKAEKRLLEFHEWLRSLKVLDPACGSGNFLYLAMHALKRVELEILQELSDVRGGALELRIQEVDPSQFYGIEVKPWAREIAELTLWIGFHQFWRQHHGNVQPDEPLLRDTGTLECRDAVLSWTEVRHDPDRDRRDATPRIPHTVTGRLVPDPEARIAYIEHLGAAPASWPEADFIIGNPPYLGKGRQRELLGDGYVEAVRAAYPEIPDGADYVMYWWYRMAEAVRSGRTLRGGLITTNSITQSQNREVLALEDQRGARVSWAIADHVWYEGGDGAEVRVAMTVVAKDPPSARLVTVERVERVRGHVPITGERLVPRLNVDLTATADVPTAAGQPLLANAGLSINGFMLGGGGFVLEATEAERILAREAKYHDVIRHYRDGSDLATRPSGHYVIDFGLKSEEEAKEYPLAYEIVRTRVYPDRRNNPRPSYARYWWRFSDPRKSLREALKGMTRYVATTETSKYRVFQFVPGHAAPDHMVVAIASDDAFLLGVLSSSIHVTWALAAGGRMGVRHTPRYNKKLCFDPFPVADPRLDARARVVATAERLSAHRQEAISGDASVTMRTMYEVLAKLRDGRSLTERERRVHDAAACGVLRDFHETLDAAVAEAYGWSWPLSEPEVLERLVALHDQRAIEERGGRVRWLRSDYQAQRFSGNSEREHPGFDLPKVEQRDLIPAPWPRDVVAQITLLRQLVATGPTSVDDALRRFSGAPRAIVARHLETLDILGEVRLVAGDRYAAALAAA